MYRIIESLLQASLNVPNDHNGRVAPETLIRSRHSNDQKNVAIYRALKLKPTQPEIGVCHLQRNMRITTWYCLITWKIHHPGDRASVMVQQLLVLHAATSMVLPACENNISDMTKETSCFLSPYEDGCSVFSIKQPNRIENWTRPSMNPCAWHAVPWPRASTKARRPGVKRAQDSLYTFKWFCAR